MAAGRISVQVKTMHEFMTGLEPGGGPTMDPPRILPVDSLLDLSRHSQIHRLAPNALRPSWTPAIAYLDEGGDAHAEGEIRHRSGQV